MTGSRLVMIGPFMRKVWPTEIDLEGIALEENDSFHRQRPVAAAGLMIAPNRARAPLQGSLVNGLLLMNLDRKIQ